MQSIDRAHLRFSLRLMFLVVFAAALICALLFTTPGVVAVPALIFMNVALPAVLTAGVVYTRGMMRAFCIGGLFPAGLALYTTGWLSGLLLYDGDLATVGEYQELVDEMENQLRIAAAASWVMILVVGRFTIGIYNLAQKYSDHRG